jgi:Domain of unknown function (DUF4055)
MAIAINDPSLPSYHSPIYLAAQDDWKFTKDMYKGRNAWIKTNGQLIGEKSRIYLPIEPGEESRSYGNRLSRSSFERRFGNAIDAFAGMLSRFTVNGELPKDMERFIDTDVDGLGNSLARFLIQADINALRDGICYILVDFSKRPAEEEMTFLKEQQLNLRPFLTLYQADQVINLRVDDQQKIKLAAIKEICWEENGTYGVERVEKYRVLFPGGGELYRMTEINGKEALILEESWDCTAPEITLVPYAIGVGTEGIFGVEPPLLDLALLNLKHYQKNSEKDEIMHKCNIPILQINRPGGFPKGTSTTSTSADGVVTRKKEEPKVTIGPSTVLFNTDAKYIEPTGNALTTTMQDLRELENAMAAKTLDFLTGNVNRTATEVVKSVAPLAGSLKGMIIAKENGVNSIFNYWQMYSGGAHQTTIQINEEAIQSAENSANVKYLMAIRQAGDISLGTFLRLIQKARVLPDSVIVEEELATIAVEVNKKII